MSIMSKMSSVYEEQTRENLPYIPPPNVRELLQTVTDLFNPITDKETLTLLASQLNDKRFVKELQDNLYEIADSL